MSQDTKCQDVGKEDYVYLTDQKRKHTIRLFQILSATAAPPATETPAEPAAPPAPVEPASAAETPAAPPATAEPAPAAEPATEAKHAVCKILGEYNICDSGLKFDPIFNMTDITHASMAQYCVVMWCIMLGRMKKAGDADVTSCINGEIIKDSESYDDDPSSAGFFSKLFKSSNQPSPSEILNAIFKEKGKDGVYTIPHIDKEITIPRKHGRIVAKLIFFFNAACAMIDKGASTTTSDVVTDKKGEKKKVMGVLYSLIHRGNRAQHGGHEPASAEEPGITVDMFMKAASKWPKNIRRRATKKPIEYTLQTREIACDELSNQPKNSITPVASIGKGKDASPCLFDTKFDDHTEHSDVQVMHGSTEVGVVRGPLGELYQNNMSKWEPVGDDTTTKYTPKSEDDRIVIQVTADVLRAFTDDDHFYIRPSYDPNARMKVLEGDWLVVNDGNFYRVYGPAFVATYELRDYTSSPGLV